MHYVVSCIDKAGHLPVRQANRAAHLEFLKANADTFLIAGPYLDAEGNMIGGHLICEAVDLKTLQTVLAEDPYARAGLFESVDIKPWKWVIGAPG
jgi:uncharacterized protein YciI